MYSVMVDTLIAGVLKLASYDSLTEAEEAASQWNEEEHILLATVPGWELHLAHVA